MVDVIPNGSLIIQIINFLVLMIVLNMLLYKPIRRVIKERREKFAAFEADITGLTGRIQERFEEMDRRLLEARRDGFQKKDQIKGEGLEVEKGLMSEAAEAAEVEIAKVRDQIKSEIVAARDTLKSEVSAFSQELAFKVLGRSLQ